MHLQVTLPHFLDPACQVSLNEDLIFSIHYVTFPLESSIFVLSDPFLDIFICIQLITNKRPVVYRSSAPFPVQFCYPEIQQLKQSILVGNAPFFVTFLKLKFTLSTAFVVYNILRTALP